MSPAMFMWIGVSAGGAVTGATVVVAQSAVQDGMTPTTGWAGGLIAGGVAVFVFLWRYMRRDLDRDHENRREDDRKKDELIDRLLAEQSAIEVRHAAERARLLEQIVELRTAVERGGES